MTSKKKKNELAWLDALQARRVKVLHVGTQGQIQSRSDPLDTWPMKRIQPMVRQAFITQDLQMDCHAEIVVIPIRNMEGLVDTLVVAEVPGLKPSSYVQIVDSALSMITHITSGENSRSIHKAS